MVPGEGRRVVRSFVPRKGRSRKLSVVDAQVRKVILNWGVLIGSDCWDE